MGAWLSRKTHFDIEARDFFLDRFTEEEFRALIGDRPASEFFSWASPSFRKLDVDREALDEDQLIALMLEQPRLIRRPLIEIDSRLLPPQSGSNRIIAVVENVLAPEEGSG